MNRYSFRHLSDHALTRELAECAARERGVTAELLARLAEYDERRLYRAVGYPSMHAYCVRELRFCEAAAYKRIRAARMARQFPVIFGLVADGRLHLSAIVLLSANLTHDNAAELFAAATHRTKAEIELMLAQRFPQPDLPERIEPLSPACLPAPPATVQELHGELSPGRVESRLAKVGEISCAGSEEPSMGGAIAPVSSFGGRLAPEPVAAPASESSGKSAAPAPRPRIMPLAPERYAIQVTVSKCTHDKLRRAQDLLRRQVPDGNVAEVLDRALELLVQDLEKRKFAATDRPSTRRAKPSRNPRHIPADVKRAVRDRDGGRCTFVSGGGPRCEARGASLEYDHEIPVARGGRSTTGNLRLRCRAHNQLEAERTYGAEFMRCRLEEARRAGGRRGAGADTRASVRRPAHGGAP